MLRDLLKRKRQVENWRMHGAPLIMAIQHGQVNPVCLETGRASKIFIEKQKTKRILFLFHNDMTCKRMQGRRMQILDHQVTPIFQFSTV